MMLIYEWKRREHRWPCTCTYSIIVLVAPGLVIGCTQLGVRLEIEKRSRFRPQRIEEILSCVQDAWLTRSLRCRSSVRTDAVLLYQR